MAAFSRMQLAAALLEYDNDLDNPEAPRRSAHESAIFANLPRTRTRKKSTDYLGVTIPSEAGASLSVRDSNYGDRRSKASFTMHNPFGTGTVDDHGDGEGLEEEEEEEPELEVDLASWGLGALVSKDKGSKKKDRSDTLPNPHDVAGPHKPAMGARSMSVGNMDALAMDSSFLAAQTSRVPEVDRRRSIGSPLDAVGMQPPDATFQRRRASSHALDNLHTPAMPFAIPFPSTSDRSASPLLGDAHGRTLSTTSMGPRPLLDQELPNPFAIEAPARERASQFDPKSTARSRVLSNASAGSRGLLNDAEFGLRPSSSASRLDPGARGRTVSNASMGSRMALDNDGMSVMTRGTRERPYSRMDLLRPKVLVMPSPLQPVLPDPVPVPRDGFRSASDGPPLPPGARTSRRVSSSYIPQDAAYLAAPIASNSFTPNPRQNLTLSQLTFRNTLMVGGQTDVTYADIDVARATEEGEQIHPEPAKVEQEVPALPTVVVEEPEPFGHPPGKLYGKSLIDDLEYRKANMKNRQRVFAGDSRPSMMARAQQQQQAGGPLIDPNSLQMARPMSQGLERRMSVGAKPLLNFESSENLAAKLLPPGVRGANGRSVFGVDTLWEREMAKLKEAEAREAQEQAEQDARDALKGKGKKGKKSKRASALEPSPIVPPSPGHVSLVTPLSAGPPVLPAISRASRAPPPQVDDGESSESEGSVDRAPAVPRQSTDTWISDDEGDPGGPRRTTGVGPRYPGERPSGPVDSDDDDLPLAATIGKATQRLKKQQKQDDSSDEELPLAALLQKNKLGLPSFDFDRKPVAGDDDDDEKPLGLRASRVMPSAEDEDDKPLGMHPEQQRRSQYHMMAAQQQQMQMQQQMMMQAQMQNSVYFGGPAASMMGSGFFGQPSPGMMMPPMPMPSPPPIQDPAKLGKIDAWRREISDDP